MIGGSDGLCWMQSNEIGGLAIVLREYGENLSEDWLFTRE